MDRSTALTALPGVGPARGKALGRLGLETVGDLLEYYPRSYEDRTRTYSIREAPEGEAVCVEATVAEPPRLSRIRKGLELVQLLCGTTGLCAGNTPEEAMLQGLMEVFERYAVKKLYQYGLTPPEIPAAPFGPETNIYPTLRRIPPYRAASNRRPMPCRDVQGPDARRARHCSGRSAHRNNDAGHPARRCS